MRAKTHEKYGPPKFPNKSPREARAKRRAWLKGWDSRKRPFAGAFTLAFGNAKSTRIWRPWLSEMQRVQGFGAPGFRKREARGRSRQQPPGVTWGRRGRLGPPAAATSRQQPPGAASSRVSIAWDANSLHIYVVPYRLERQFAAYLRRFLSLGTPIRCIFT